MYVIKTIHQYKTNAGETKTMESYFEREGMSGLFNVMSGLDGAKKFEFITEARRIKRMRFKNESNVSIVKI